MASFAACKASKSATTCKQNGGSWTTVGPSPELTCVCPTGQQGCACTRSTDCLGSCRATPSPGTLYGCDGVTQGSCSSHHPSVGCWCWFGKDGTVIGICAD